VRRCGVDDSVVAAIIYGGKPVGANKARDAASVIHCADARLKMDAGVQSAAMLGILNALPHHFLSTLAVVVQDGTPCGDVARWVDGVPIRRLTELAVPWLRLNNILASIGLVEPHFKLGDYVRRGEDVVDVDVDMVNHCENVALAHNYLERWRVPAGRAMGAEIADYVARNLADEWVFREALARIEGRRDGD